MATALCVENLEKKIEYSEVHPDAELFKPFSRRIEEMQARERTIAGCIIIGERVKGLVFFDYLLQHEVLPSIRNTLAEPKNVYHKEEHVEMYGNCISMLFPNKECYGLACASFDIVTFGDFELYKDHTYYESGKEYRFMRGGYEIARTNTECSIEEIRKSLQGNSFCPSISKYADNQHVQHIRNRKCIYPWIEMFGNELRIVIQFRSKEDSDFIKHHLDEVVIEKVAC